MEKLLITPKPYNYESIYSYLLRLTNENMYPTPYWIYDSTGLVKKDLKIILPSSQILKNLQKLTNLPLDELNNLTYFSDLLVFTEKRLEYSIVYNYSIDGKYSKVCPVCLKESLYQRKVWDFKTVISCPFHGCLLVNKCPKCNKKIRHYRKEIHLCSCGEDLRDLPIIQATNNELSYANLIYNKMGIQTPIQLNYVSKEISNLELYQILFLSISLLNRIYYLKEDKFLKLNFNTDDEVFRSYIAIISQVFINWPHGFYDYLNIYQSSSNTTNKSGVSYDFHQLYLYMYRVMSSDYKFLKDEFENFIEFHWEEGSVSSFKYLGIENSKLLSAETALQKYNITPGTLKKLIIDEKVKGKFIQKRRAFVLAEEESLKSFISYMEKFTSKVKAMKLLGVNLKNINLLIDNGLIHEEGYLFNRLRKGNLLMSDLFGILNFLEKISPESVKCKNPINMDSTLISISNKYLNIIDLYKMIELNLVTPYNDLTSKGMRSFHFDKHQLEEAVNDYLLNHCDFLTPKLISSIHGIHEVSIYAFINAGFLPSKKISSNHKILKKDLELFFKTYITTHELSILLNLNQNKIRLFLQEKGIEPALISNKKVNRPYLYKREDIEMVLSKRAQ